MCSLLRDLRRWDFDLKYIDKYTKKRGDCMQAQVREWGNSQGIRLSKDILKSAGIALNEMLEVTVSDGVITLAKTFRHKTLEERAAEYNGRLMLDGEYDWGEPVGREVW
jgi:antitoxin MazE